MKYELKSNPQPVTNPPGKTALFMSFTIKHTPQAEQTIKAFCTDFQALIRSMTLRDFSRSFCAIMGFGSDAWDRLFAIPKPKKLHTFQEIKGDKYTAPSTPADLFFHLRANDIDHCFEFAREMMIKIGKAVDAVDEVFGHRSFDARGILGFVDGTENPLGIDAIDYTLIGDEDPEFIGGSYVIAQRYVHDMDAWTKTPIEQQERIIGRQKLDDIELSAKQKPHYAHNFLTSITDENGNDLKIVRDNLPYGSPAHGIYGTYFIGYAKDPAVTEKMLRNMFIGDPRGNYDKILDFSTAKTGALFFIPTLNLLKQLANK